MRSLPNRDLELGDVDLSANPLSDLLRRSGFEEQLQGFAKIVPSLLDGVALTGDIDLRTKRRISRTLSLDDGGQSHDPVSHWTLS
jgi:hypothetical protein